MYKLEDLFAEFLYYSKLRGLTVKTLKKYNAHLTVFQRNLSSQGITQFEEVNSFVIRRFLYSIVEEGKADINSSFFKSILLTSI